MSWISGLNFQSDDVWSYTRGWVRTSLGVIWTLSQINGSNNILLKYSTDDGASWTLAHTFTDGVSPLTGDGRPLPEWLLIDANDCLHMLIRDSDSSVSQQRYFTAVLNGTHTGFSTGPTYRNLSYQLGNRYTVAPILFHWQGDIWIVLFNGSSTSQYYLRWTGDVATGTPPATWQEWTTSGPTYSTSGGGEGIALRHNGDGFTPDTQPDFGIYYSVSSGVDTTTFRKVTWNGSGWTLGAARNIRAEAIGHGNGRIALDYDPVGQQWWMTDTRNSQLNLHVYTRNLADTTTTTRHTASGPSAQANSQPTGSVFVMYGSRVFVLVFHYSLFGWKEWLGGTSWTGWTSAAAGSGLNHWPWTEPWRFERAKPYVGWYRDNGTGQGAMLFGFELLNQAPTAPTIDAPADGNPQDVNASLLVDWTFNDPDGGDSQSAYTLRRRIGAAAYEYWNGSAWQASEDASTKIASTGTSQTLASGWGADPDADHYYSVKTWDASDAGPSPWSAEARVVPTVKAPPTITSPATDGASVGATHTVTWTVASQSKYRVRLLGDNAGSPDTGNVISDTGIVVDSGARSRTIAFPTNGVTRHLELTTTNSEGLDADPVYRRVVVTYTPPAVPTLTVTGDSPLGAVTVAIDNPTPGAEPAPVSNDLWRRVVGDTGDGIRLAASLAVDGSHTDWHVAKGVQYEYRAIVTGDNGATNQSGWTA